MVGEAAGRFVDRIAGHLNHPRLGRMPGHTSESHPTAFQIQEEEDVISHEAAPCQDLDGEEIRSRQNSHMRRDELFPSSLLAALGRGCDAVALQDVPDGLIRDLMTEVGERAHDAIVTPAGVLLSHTDDQSFDCCIYTRTTRIRATLGSVELPGNQPSIPCENGLWLRYTRHVGQTPTAKSLADLGQSGPFQVREPEPRGKL